MPDLAPGRQSPYTTIHFGFGNDRGEFRPQEPGIELFD